MQKNQFTAKEKYQDLIMWNRVTMFEELEFIEKTMFSHCRCYILGYKSGTHPLAHVSGYNLL